MVGHQHPGVAAPKALDCGAFAAALELQKLRLPWNGARWVQVDGFGGATMPRTKLWGCPVTSSSAIGMRVEGFLHDNSPHNFYLPLISASWESFREVNVRTPCSPPPPPCYPRQSNVCLCAKWLHFVVTKRRFHAAFLHSTIHSSSGPDVRQASEASQGLSAPASIAEPLADESGGINRGMSRCCCCIPVTAHAPRMRYSCGALNHFLTPPPWGHLGGTFG